VTHVFVSYHHESNSANARRVVSALTAAGYEAWWDEHLPAHRKYREVLIEKLRESQAVVVLWSKQAARSDWVVAEADIAHSLGKLVQASTDAELPPIPFNQIQCARLQGWKGDADHPDWIKVLESVRAVAGAGKREPAQPRATTGSCWRTPLAAALALAAILIAVGLYWTSGGGRSAAPVDPTAVTGAERVAVVAFTAAQEPSLETFARSLADQIAEFMSKNGLQAIPSASSDDFRGTTLKAAAERIGVSFVLDGSIQQEGDALRVNTHIIDAKTNVTLWSNEFRRASAESTAMQEQVAAHVVDVLRCALVSRRPNAGVIDPQTLAIFMRACDVAERFDGKPEEIYESARQVTVRAPEFARGWGLLAMASAYASWNVSPERHQSLVAQARAAAEKANALDPANAEGDLALSMILPQRDWRGRQALVQRAMGDNPNSAEVHFTQGTLLAEVGRMTDALGFFRRAVALDPLSPSNWSGMLTGLSGTGNMIEARQTLEHMLQVWPNSRSIWFNRFNRTAFLGPPEAALAMLDAVDSAPITMEQPVRAAWRKYLLARRDGKKDAIHAALEDFVALAHQGQFGGIFPISAAAQVGEVDFAYALADEYYRRTADPVYAEPIGGAARYSLFMPPAAALRKDARFMILMKRLGLVDYWTETGKWPDFCADVPYDCKAEGARAT